MSEFTIASAAGQRMLDLLPSYYEKVRETRVVMEAEGKEFDHLSAAAGDVLNQFFVETATWGLDKWESEFDIVPQSGQPDDQRRSVIRARIRGTGTVTEELMGKVAAAYINGEIEVTQQPAMYQFTVKFVSTLGIPANLNDLKAAIEKIKPAHMDVVYLFRYLFSNEVEAMTLSEIEVHRLTDFAPFI